MYMSVLHGGRVFKLFACLFQDKVNTLKCKLKDFVVSGYACILNLVDTIICHVYYFYSP